MKFVDSRINNQLAAWQYKEIINEYLIKMGKKECSGFSMSYVEFQTSSYARNRSEKQVNVTINYKDQTIELIEV